MKKNLMRLAGVSVLALATSVQADIIINFQDLPAGYTFPAGTLTPYDGLYVDTISGANQTTGAGLQLDSGEGIVFYTPGLVSAAPNTYFTLDSLALTATDVVEVVAVDTLGDSIGNGLAPTGTYSDPFDGVVLGGFAIVNDDTGPSTINSLTLDFVSVPEPSQLASGLALASLGGLGLVMRRFRYRQ